MGRKSLAERIRESGEETRQGLAASAEKLHQAEAVSGEAATAAPVLAGGNGGNGKRHAEPPVKKEPSREEKEAAALYDEACQYLTGILELVKQGKALTLDDGFSIVSDMVESLAASEALYVRALHFDTSLRFLPQHSVNVAIYSIRLASWLGLGEEEQVKVGATGLFHDVGKGLISDNIFYKQSSVTEGELSAIRKSVEKNHEILSRVQGQHTFLAECALQVYERVDGSGYPRGLKRGEIHEYAQIAGLADLYEALTHDRPHRPGQSHFNAAKVIVDSYKNAFDRNLVKTLLLSFSIFPLESYVRLNSGAVGRVTKTHPGLPTKPAVQIVYDSHGNRVWTEQELDLAKEPLLYVIESVGKDGGRVQAN
ncbi:MAG: HD domain-containing phosphohydrolase [Thermodesulfobacteriota bacterium]